jgi:hypothetical protein
MRERKHKADTPRRRLLMAAQIQWRKMSGYMRETPALGAPEAIASPALIRLDPGEMEGSQAR